MKTHPIVAAHGISIIFAPLLKIYRSPGARQRIRQALSPCRPRFLFATLNVNETLRPSFCLSRPSTFLCRLSRGWMGGQASERAGGSRRSPILVVVIPKRKLRRPSRAYVSSGEINRGELRLATLATSSPSSHPDVTLIFPTVHGFPPPPRPSISFSSRCWGYDKTELSKRVVFARGTRTSKFSVSARLSWYFRPSRFSPGSEIMGFAGKQSSECYPS